MNNHLTTVHEKFSKTWPFAAISSSVMAVLLFIGSRLTPEILISGYLELASFVLFVVAVFSYFKLRDGKITIRVDKNDGELIFTYLLKGSEVAQESLAIDQKVEFKTDRMPDMSLSSDINRSDRTIRFRTDSSDSWQYLFQYNQRVIPVTPQHADNIQHILTEACSDEF
jgi:hypothetical protein